MSACERSGNAFLDTAARARLPGIFARLVAAGLITMETAMDSSAYPKEVQAQMATARAQLQAHATMSTGQAGSSGAATYGDEQAPSEQLPAPTGS